jgi:hypothetical protein
VSLCVLGWTIGRRRTTTVFLELGADLVARTTCGKRGFAMARGGLCTTGAGLTGAGDRFGADFGRGFDTGFGAGRGAGSGSGAVTGAVVGGGGASVVVVSVRTPSELAPATACSANRNPPESRERTAATATTTLLEPRRPATPDLPDPTDESSADPTSYNLGGPGRRARGPPFARDEDRSES